MELIKLGKDKYLVKNSNGKIINERERLELENKDLIIKDFESNDCQKETTKKIKKNKKKIKEIMEEEKNKKVEEIETYDEKDIKETANKENADGAIKETISTD